MVRLCGWVGGESRESFFQGSWVFYVEGGDGGVATEDLAVEAGEDFAWAYFDEVSGGLGDEEVDALDPADGAGDLADEGVAGVGVAGGEAGVYVGGDGDVGIVEVDAFKLDHEGLLGGCHEGAMEGGGDAKEDGLFCSGGFAEVDGAVDGGGGAGDDCLVGGVEVGGGDGGLVEDVLLDVGVGLDDWKLREVGTGRGGFEADELGAEFVGGQGAKVDNLVGGEAEDGGHGTLSGRDGLLHEAATGADGAYGVGEGEGSGGNVGGVLAERVSCGDGGGDAVFCKDAGGGDRDGEDGGLSVLGELEGVFRSFEDDFRKGKAEGVVCFFKYGAGGGEGFNEGVSHAYGLGALTGKEEGWLDHRCLS